LPTVRAARFDEVSQQVVLTGHLVDALFLVIQQKTWERLNPSQQKAVQQAAQAAAQYNNDHRLEEEKTILQQFQKQGLRITTPDVNAFRTHVTQHYQSSEMAKTWPAGLLARIEAVR
jgi:TRAP-type C4-dicarboxylate transport system substrate-binding protein